MPKAAASAKATFMFKEKGGKAQVEFRDSLGLCEREDLQFQKIKVGDERPTVHRVRLV